MAGTYNTAFAESEVILAVSAADYEYADKTLAEMSNAELKALSSAAQEVRNMITDLLWRRREGLS